MYWPNLDELDPEAVDANYAIIAQMVEEKHPELNARRGVLGDLVTELHAIMQTAGMEAIDRLRRSMSALELARDPENASPGAVDALASNYRVARRISKKAQGYITVGLSRSSGINFSKNATFRARGQLFRVQRQVSVRPPGSQQHGRNDVAVTVHGHNMYEVQVPVIAAEVNDAAMLKRGDPCEPGIRPTGFMTAFATSDFTGGIAPQTNEDLVRQLQVGAALPGFSGPANIKALIRGVTQDCVDVAVLGACDAEMTRDQQSNGVSAGGKLDIYLKSRNGQRADEIVEIVQARVDAPEVHQPGLSVLVKAAKAAWLSVEIRIAGTVDAVACKEAVVKYVTSLPIGMQPTPFQIAAVLPDPEAVADVKITGAPVDDRTKAAYLDPDNVHIHDAAKTT